jgi:hypothetical protein
MTTFELEVAAYAAAHRIYNGLSAPDRPCPGGYRSRMIDQIAEEIKTAFSVHHGLASSGSSASPEVESVRQGHGWITGTGQAFREDIPPSGLRQTRYWRDLRHAFDSGGCINSGNLSPCLKCAMPRWYGNHFTLSGLPLQGEEFLLVERSRGPVETQSD